jgi:hypothetical protein
VLPFRDGTYLSVSYPTGFAATRAASIPEYLLRADAEGIVLGTLAVLLGPYPGLEVPLPDAGMLVAPPPIRCRDRWAVGPEGDRLCLPRQSHLCEARRAAYPELVTLRLGGE